MWLYYINIVESYKNVNLKGPLFRNVDTIEKVIEKKRKTVYSWNLSKFNMFFFGNDRRSDSGKLPLWKTILLPPSNTSTSHKCYWVRVENICKNIKKKFRIRLNDGKESDPSPLDILWPKKCQCYLIFY